LDEIARKHGVRKLERVPSLVAIKQFSRKATRRSGH